MALAPRCEAERLHGLFPRRSLLGFWQRWVGTRVPATPKGLDIHLFLSSLSFDKYGSGRSYIGVNRFNHVFTNITGSLSSPYLNDKLARLGASSRQDIGKSSEMHKMVIPEHKDTAQATAARWEQIMRQIQIASAGTIYPS